MNEIIESLSNDILGSVITEKTAEEILSPMFEKTAGGIGAFAEALTGSKVKRLKNEVGALAEEVSKKSTSPKLQEAEEGVRSLKEQLSNSANHERMDSVKNKVDEARDKYQSISRKNDDTINAHSGLRTPLRLVSPKYWIAAGQNGVSKLGLNNAKAQYKAQQHRIEKDLIEELSGSKTKLNNAKREVGLDTSHKQLEDKMRQLSHAESATKSSRGLVGVGGAVAGGAYLYNKKKNGPGPYSFGDDYSTNRVANECDNEFIEKLSEEIIQCMYEK